MNKLNLNVEIEVDFLKNPYPTKEELIEEIKAEFESALGHIFLDFSRKTEIKTNFIVGQISNMDWMNES